MITTKNTTKTFRDFAPFSKIKEKEMTKYALTIVLFIFVILSYILGILAFSSKEARDHKWQEYYKKI